MWTKKNNHDFLNFFSFSIYNHNFDTNHIYYSYKYILCEFEAYFQRKPIRPFPKKL